MKKLALSFLFLCCLFFVPLPAHADYPNFQGYVNDFAHVLSDQFIQTLTNKLTVFDQKTTNQIAVVTINTTKPETIEEYSIHLAEKWKPGKKGIDNGIIMLFAMQDHTMRIEVGRGLEGNLTDIQSKHILNDVIRPEFRAGNFERGIDNGVNAVIKTITPSYATVSGSLSVATASSTLTGSDLLILGIVFLFILIFLIAFSPFSPFGGAGVWGIPMVWGSGKDDSQGGGFGGFGGGTFSGGGASSDW